MTESTDQTPDVAEDVVVTPADAPGAGDSDGDATTSVEAAAPAEPATEAPAAPAEPATEAPAPETPAPVAAEQTASTAAPSGTPASRPVPRPVPRPSARPVAATQAAPPERAVAAIPDEHAQTQAALAFGRVEEDGSVYVTEAAGERLVGQFPGVPQEEAIGLYVRRFLDLQAKVALFEARLGSAELTHKEIDATLAKLEEETSEPAAVGDLDGLRGRIAALSTLAAARRSELDAERTAAKEVALAARTAIVEAAEKLAGADPAKIQWKPAGEELHRLLEAWKTAQRSGPRIDRPSEEALWKRFSHARTTFDRERRHFFAELEKQNSGAKAAKLALVAEAERLASSTDWGSTAAAYRDLMTQWKAAGRANRKDDDALWTKFRRAQDTFFAAREAANAATDAEYGENLVVKEAILTEAEALLPVTNLDQAKTALRVLQERWESAGKVPRADVQRVEARMRAVETAVRDAEQAKWTRSNPETRARAEGAAAQLETAIEGLEKDLAAAQAAGDKRRIKEYEAALAARRSWLEQIVRAAEDSKG